jgi:hypothetical protein
MRHLPVRHPEPAEAIRDPKSWPISMACHQSMIFTMPSVNLFHQLCSLSLGSSMTLFYFSGPFNLGLNTQDPFPMLLF